MGLENGDLKRESAEQSRGVDFDELMRKYDTEARFRTPPGWQLTLIAFLCAALSAFHFYTAGMGLLPSQKQGAVHLGLVLVIVFLLYPIKSGMPKNVKIPIYDFALAVLAAVPLIYLVHQLDTIAMERSGLPSDTDLIMGFLLVVALLEATRRISNPVLPGLAVAALFYCYFGRSMPVLSHRGFTITRIINHMYLGTEGIFGVPLEVSSTFVFMFILFGSVLEKTGMGRFIIDLSMALAGWSTGGPAKVAVVASGLMGTISGSSVANVCTTGMFTIPLMKSVGYKPYFAGAVEAVASTGGQIMPPVMGAGAFIMAQFLGVGYLEVAVAAIVPALLYYFAVIVQVHFEAKRLSLVGLPREQLPKAGVLLREKGFLLIPLAAIVYLLVAGFTPLMAAFAGIIVSVTLSWINFFIRRNNIARETLLTPKRLAEAFEAGARGALSVACACACVGIVVGTGTLTGLALRVAGAIVDLAGGHLLLTLFFTMCASILLGTGLPTTANFIVTSTMAAPALTREPLNVPAIAAYMFVFYFGIAADLTPPVALAAYAGAGIAGDDPMKTGAVAFKLALAGFLVPYIYVYNPILLFVGAEPIQMIQAVATALIGVFLLAMCTIGHYKAPLHWILRAGAFLGALALLDPGTLTDAVGLALLVFIHLFQTAKAKKGTPSAS
ncbi:MAG: TRAP transporter permease [Synergistaceae bacterium]|jgi:TRAP transporter 4TM/12TM fusion protein|nr:TRAP transporter permease [Synergistaceae bacterium]